MDARRRLADGEPPLASVSSVCWGHRKTLRETSRTSTGALVGVAPRGAVVASSNRRLGGEAADRRVYLQRGPPLGPISGILLTSVSRLTQRALATRKPRQSGR